MKQPAKTIYLPLPEGQWAELQLPRPLRPGEFAWLMSLMGPLQRAIEGPWDPTGRVIEEPGAMEPQSISSDAAASTDGGAS